MILETRIIRIHSVRPDHPDTEIPGKTSRGHLVRNLRRHKQSELKGTGKADKGLIQRQAGQPSLVSHCAHAEKRWTSVNTPWRSSKGAQHARRSRSCRDRWRRLRLGSPTLPGLGEARPVPSTLQHRSRPCDKPGKGNTRHTGTQPLTCLY